MLKLILLLLLLVVMAACGGRNRENGEQDAPTYYPEEPPQASDDYAPPYEEEYAEPQAPDIPPYNNYRVTLEIDPYSRTVQGISQITFTNRTGEPLETIVLRVYLNAFQENFYPPPFFSEFAPRVFRGARSYGYMNIQYATLDNEELEHKLDGTVLTLHLPEPLPHGVTIDFLLQYNAYIPRLAHHTGGNDYAMWFGMFLPVLATHDEQGWSTAGHYPAGSPFLLEKANYQVAVITPLRYMVVGTGLRLEEVIEDTDTRITQFTAHTTRDFAFAVSAYFNHAHTSTESGIEIHLYYYTEGLEIDGILDHARLSMEYFEERVGSYPFGHVTIVEAHTKLDSAAFSQIVLVDSWYLHFGELWALSHGLGAQWFSHVVGTNRIAEPWLSDGLTRFIQAGIFYPTNEELRERIEREHALIASRENLFLSHGLNAFDNWSRYENTHGRKAMLMVYALYRQMGEEAFWGLINRYYHEFSFSFATAEDFIRLAEEIYGGSLQAFFSEWMRSGGVPPLP